MWVLESFKTIAQLESSPIVAVTYHGFALMGALQFVLPGTANISCCWHINSNVLRKWLNKFPSKED